MALVLLVEDNPDLQFSLSLLLARQGHEVAQALDGKQALAHLRQHTVDIVLTDVLMPEVDGLEVMRTMRREFPQVPVIAMSGGSDRLPGGDMLQMAGLLGARAILSKPFTGDELRDALAQALGA
jgi:CheY-like chemotaxis protein